MTTSSAWGVTSSTRSAAATTATRTLPSLRVATLTPRSAAEGQRVTLPGGRHGIRSLRVPQPDTACERTAGEPDLRAVPHRHAPWLRPERPRAVRALAQQRSPPGDAVAGIQPHAANRSAGNLRIPSGHPLAPERAPVLRRSRNPQAGGGAADRCGPPLRSPLPVRSRIVVKGALRVVDRRQVLHPGIARR